MERICFVDYKLDPSKKDNMSGVNKVLSFGPFSFNVNSGEVVSANSISCKNDHSLVNELCVVSNQTRACTVQPAHSSGGLESTSNGGVTWGSCSSFNCSATFTSNGSACVFNESFCTAAGGIIDLGTGGGSCKFTSGVSASKCSQAGYSNTVQYYNPGGSAGSYNGTPCNATNYYSCSIPAGISSAQVISCEYGSYYRFGCGQTYDYRRSYLSVSSTQVWCNN